MGLVMRPAKDQGDMPIASITARNARGNDTPGEKEKEKKTWLRERENGCL